MLLLSIMSTETYIKTYKGWEIVRKANRYEIFCTYTHEHVSGFRTIDDAMDHIAYIER